MVEAYSRLRYLLDQHSLSQADLLRRLAGGNLAVNSKTLSRSANSERPIERLDLRVVGAICRVLGVGLDELIAFAEPAELDLQTLPPGRERRLDDLLERHREGHLDPLQMEELRDLVDEAETLAHRNARRLADHRRRLRTAAKRTSAAG